MKRILKASIAIMILFLFSTTTYGAELESKSKTINKHYVVSASNELNVSNSFGNIEITTWDKNEISIEINIEVSHKKPEKAQEKLDKIDFEFKKDNNEVSIRLIGEHSTNKSSKKHGNLLMENCKNCEEMLQIDFTIKMPKTNNLVVKNSFGNVTINQLTGKMSLDLKFGNFEVKQLLNDGNNIAVQFGNISASHFGGGTLKSKFGNVNITTFESGTLQTSFSKSAIGKAQTIKLTAQHGNIKIGSINNISGKASFGAVKIDSLFGSIDLQLNHGNGLTVKYIAEDYTGIEVNSQFADVDLDFYKTINANMDLSVTFGKIKMPMIDVQNSYVENSKQNKTIRKGSVGNKENKPRLDVVLQHADLIIGIID